MYKLIAHRGDKTRYPENTLDAFKDAINNNDYVGFECDVRQTKDNVFVIHHDPIFKGQLIKSMLYKSFDNKITLKDVLNLTTNKIIVIDIKDPFIDTDKFLEIINESDHNIYVISFYNSVLKKIKKDKRTYKIGLLNYLANSNIDEQNYDIDCLLGIVCNTKLINKYKILKKELLFYGISKENVNNQYPFYIVD